MKIVVVMMSVLTLCACAAGGGANSATVGPNPFPVERGSAAPPPAVAGNGRAAPPEGRARDGAIDFGQWRSADPARYGPAFEAQMQTRLTASTERAQAKADLESNGFSCDQSAGKLDCRIEIMERQCAYDWYVVLEDGRAAPAAGFDQMCLGARSERGR